MFQTGLGTTPSAHSMENDMKIHIKKHLVHTVKVWDESNQSVDVQLETAPFEIFEVEMQRDAGEGHVAGVWNETFGSRYALELFMRGVRAGMGMAGEMMPLNYEIPL